MSDGMTNEYGQFTAKRIDNGESITGNLLQTKPKHGSQWFIIPAGCFCANGLYQSILELPEIDPETIKPVSISETERVQNIIDGLNIDDLAHVWNGLYEDMNRDHISERPSRVLQATNADKIRVLERVIDVTC